MARQQSKKHNAPEIVRFKQIYPDPRPGTKETLGIDESGRVWRLNTFGNWELTTLSNYRVVKPGFQWAPLNDRPGARG